MMNTKKENPICAPKSAEKNDPNIRHDYNAINQFLIYSLSTLYNMYSMYVYFRPSFQTIVFTKSSKSQILIILDL